jgi:hypothetical protein
LRDFVGDEIADALQGRPFGPEELAEVQALIGQRSDWSRYRLSRELARPPRHLLGITNDREPIGKVAVAKRISPIGHSRFDAGTFPGVIEGIGQRSLCRDTSPFHFGRICGEALLKVWQERNLPSIDFASCCGPFRRVQPDRCQSWLSELR